MNKPNSLPYYPEGTTNNILTQDNFNNYHKDRISAYIVNRYDFYEVIILRGFSLHHSERYKTYPEAFDRCSQVNS